MPYTHSDIVRRIKATLPVRWFGPETPILDSVLSSLAAGWTQLFELLNYTRDQTRIGSAYDFWLDLIAKDYFGDRIRRRQRETDLSLRQRISLELVRDRCTRASISGLLRDLTGRRPFIFEPANPRDTGCYNSLDSDFAGSAGFNMAGGWGSLDLPFQVFIRTYRPVATGVAMINGWCGDIGAYGSGLCSYIDLAADLSRAGDSEIYQRVCQTAPIGTVVWVSIEP